MAKKVSSRTDFHGDPSRFPVVAEFISQQFGTRVKYVADVAGGQGMLTRLLRQKYNYDSEVLDPRGWRLKGVPGRESGIDPLKATYYDLVVGLHPDQATRDVALCALFVPTVLIPCCNYWDRTVRLGTIALVERIEQYFCRNGVRVSRVNLELDTPKRIALVTSPPANLVDFEHAKSGLPSEWTGAGRRSSWMDGNRKR